MKLTAEEKVQQEKLLVKEFESAILENETALRGRKRIRSIAIYIAILMILNVGNAIMLSLLQYGWSNDLFVVFLTQILPLGMFAGLMFFLYKTGFNVVGYYLIFNAVIAIPAFIRLPFWEIIKMGYWPLFFTQIVATIGMVSFFILGVYILSSKDIKEIASLFKQYVTPQKKWKS